jgi:hypothetical protein
MISVADIVLINKIVSDLNFLIYFYELFLLSHIQHILDASVN